MANQGSDRREVLEMLAKAAIASQFPGFSRWVFAQQHDHNHAADAAPPARQPNYQPSYFSPSEYRTIDVLTGLIIPKTKAPARKMRGSVNSSISWLPTVKSRFSNPCGMACNGWI